MKFKVGDVVLLKSYEEALEEFGLNVNGRINTKWQPIEEDFLQAHKTSKGTMVFLIEEIIQEVYYKNRRVNFAFGDCMVKHKIVEDHNKEIERIDFLQ